MTEKRKNENPRDMWINNIIPNIGGRQNVGWCTKCKAMRNCYEIGKNRYVCYECRKIVKCD